MSTTLFIKLEFFLIFSLNNRGRNHRLPDQSVQRRTFSTSKLQNHNTQQYTKVKQSFKLDLKPSEPIVNSLVNPKFEELPKTTSSKLFKSEYQNTSKKNKVPNLETNIITSKQIRNKLTKGKDYFTFFGHENFSEYLI